jgi:hypothetical protein
MRNFNIVRKAHTTKSFNKPTDLSKTGMSTAVVMLGIVPRGKNTPLVMIGTSCFLR